MAKSNNPDRGLEHVGKQWRGRFTYHNKVTRSPLFPTKTEARAYYTKAKTAERLGKAFPELVSGFMKGPLMTDVIEQYLRPITRKKAEKGERGMADHWKERFESGVLPEPWCSMSGRR